MTTQLNAANITVSETLAILDSQFEAFADGVAENRYAMWLGSGISLDRVDSLGEIVARVIEFLRKKIAHGNPHCRFYRALKRILALAHLSNEEESHVDLTQAFPEWQCAQAITDRLIINYSMMLEIRVDGEPDDFLLWNGVDVVATFADSTVEPDVEHLCIAILILEGVVTEIATANWDGLVEKALEELTSSNTSVVVLVRPEDVREPDLGAKIIKFHGCALRASADEETFRSYLIGRHSQIHGWVEQPEYAPMVTGLVDLIVRKPTLMMGLSAQDADIHLLFARAAAVMSWPWPGDRPSFVISDDSIDLTQQSLLSNVYRRDCISTAHSEIMNSALIRAYAKPLLISLVLYVLFSKLKKLILIAGGTFSAPAREALQTGVVAVRDLLANAVEPDSLDFVRTLVSQSSLRFMIFRTGIALDPPRSYSPITSYSILRMENDTTLLTSGIPEVAVAIGILGIGISDGSWTLDALGSDQDDGTIRINSAIGSIRAYFVTNSHAALFLQNDGRLDDGANTVVIHSLKRTSVQQRSPHRVPGRTGRLGQREVSISELMSEVNTSEELVQRFREELAL